MLVWEFLLGLAAVGAGFGLAQLRRQVPVKPLQSFRKSQQLIAGWVASERDMLYFLELQPTPRLRYACPPLDRLLGDQPCTEKLDDAGLFLSLLHPEDRGRIAGIDAHSFDFNQPLIYRIRNHEGCYVWYEEYRTPVYHQGELYAVQGILRNVHERILEQTRMQYRVSHDGMTGLHNREHYEELVKRYNEEECVPLALILCDMDNLKRVNDTYGHQRGDLYIQEAARLLKEFAAENVIISRIGGDEFSVLVLDGTQAQAESLIRSIRQRIAAYPSEEIGFSMDMSVGCAWTTQSIGRMEELFLEADQEMYRQKSSKKEVQLQALTAAAVDGDDVR